MSRSKVVSCTECGAFQYRTDGISVLDPVEQTCMRCGAPYDSSGNCSRRSSGCQGGRGEYMLPSPPIVLVYKDYMRVVFCSRTCASRWILKTPDADLRGGRPIF